MPKSGNIKEYMKNKFTLEEFVEFCQQNPYLDNIKKTLEVEITKDLIKKIDLKPKQGGFYYTSQLVDIPRLLIENKNEIQEIFDGPNDDILTINPSLIDGAAKNIHLQHITYLLLAKKFQKFIEEKRQLFLMPRNGFENHDKFIAWINNQTKKFRKSDKEEHKFSFIQSRALIANTIIRLINNESKKYDSSVGFCISDYWYLIFNYLIFNDPFFNDKSKDETRKKKLKTQIKIPLQKNPQTGTFELNILISKNTTKDDIIKTLDKEWKTINDWQERLPSVLKYRKKSLDNLHRDFIIYQLSQKGLNDIEIQKKVGDLELNHIRKIISDTKKRIEKTWGK